MAKIFPPTPPPNIHIPPTPIPNANQLPPIPPKFPLHSKKPENEWKGHPPNAGIY